MNNLCSECKTVCLCLTAVITLTNAASDGFITVTQEKENPLPAHAVGSFFVASSASSTTMNFGDVLTTHNQVTGDRIMTIQANDSLYYISPKLK